MVNKAMVLTVENSWGPRAEFWGMLLVIGRMGYRKREVWGKSEFWAILLFIGRMGCRKREVWGKPEFWGILVFTGRMWHRKREVWGKSGELDQVIFWLTPNIPSHFTLFHCITPILAFATPQSGLLTVWIFLVWGGNDEPSLEVREASEKGPAQEGNQLLGASEREASHSDVRAGGWAASGTLKST